MSRVTRLVFIALLSITSLLSTMAHAEYRSVLQENASLPVTTFNITFQTGSADDPKGSEGLASLTAELLREGGVKEWNGQPARSRAEIEEFLFPLAANIDVNVGNEQTTFAVTTTASDSAEVFKMLAQMILAPALDPAELARLKDEVLVALQKQMPLENQEDVGKAVLNRRIFGDGHPYSHVTLGTVAGVQSVDVEKIRRFREKFLTQKRVIVGIAGVIDAKLKNDALTIFNALPVGTTVKADIPRAPSSDHSSLTIVTGPFDATGAHLGHALPINRSQKDHAPLYMANLAFGKHRSFVGRLMKVVREVRGLNYGTYSYVEDFPNSAGHMSEPTQVARSHQSFTMWGRPTPLENGCFLLKQMHREVESLGKNGLTAAEFQLAQSHLIGLAPILGTSLERRLGYAIDSIFYGIEGDYLLNLQKTAKRLTLRQVNTLLKKYIHPEAMQMVVVTRDAEAFKRQILGNECSITYQSGIEKPKAVVAEDKLISKHPIGVQPTHISVVEAPSLFLK